MSKGSFLKNCRLSVVIVFHVIKWVVSVESVKLLTLKQQGLFFLVSKSVILDECKSGAHLFRDCCFTARPLYLPLSLILLKPSLSSTRVKERLFTINLSPVSHIPDSFR